MSAAFDIQTSPWLENAKVFLGVAAKLAKFTEFKYDDYAVLVLQTAVDNDSVLELIEWLINKHLESPSTSAETLLSLAPHNLTSAANAVTVGKIGDGKFLELVAKYLPLILSLLAK